MTDLEPPRVALTFEAAGDPEPTLPILEILRSSSVLSIFFIDGRWATANPELVKKIAAEGHSLGNHGFVHPDWTTMSEAAIRDDLKQTERLIERLTGRPIAPWARPPYGAIDERVLTILKSAGYNAIYRDAVDGGHWPGETTVANIHRRALQSARHGEVVVFHTNRPETVEALPAILRDFQAAGTRLVPLADLPQVPAARPPLHPDFGGLTVRPGYIHPQVAGRWQSLNVLELGALLHRETNAAEELVDLDGSTIQLITGDPADPADWVQPSSDGFVLVIEGELRCEFHGVGGADAGFLIARVGDLFRCPAAFAYRLGPVSSQHRRWIALRWQPSNEYPLHS